MMYNSLAQETLREEHCQDIQREFAQQRTVRHVSQEQSGAGRHLVGSMGRQLVTLGKWLEQVESRKHAAYDI